MIRAGYQDWIGELQHPSADGGKPFGQLRLFKGTFSIDVCFTRRLTTQTDLQQLTLCKHFGSKKLIFHQPVLNLLGASYMVFYRFEDRTLPFLMAPFRGPVCFLVRSCSEDL